MPGPSRSACLTPTYVRAAGSFGTHAASMRARRANHAAPIEALNLDARHRSVINADFALLTARSAARTAAVACDPRTREYARRTRGACSPLVRNIASANGSRNSPGPARRCRITQSTYSPYSPASYASGHGSESPSAAASHCSARTEGSSRNPPHRVASCVAPPSRHRPKTTTKKPASATLVSTGRLSLSQVY